MKIIVTVIGSIILASIFIAIPILLTLSYVNTWDGRVQFMLLTFCIGEFLYLFDNILNKALKDNTL